MMLPLRRSTHVAAHALRGGARRHAAAAAERLVSGARSNEGGARHVSAALTDDANLGGAKQDMQPRTRACFMLSHVQLTALFGFQSAHLGP